MASFSEVKEQDIMGFPFELAAYGKILGAGDTVGANAAGFALTSHATGLFTITLEEPLPEAECIFVPGSSWVSGSPVTNATAAFLSCVHTSDTVKVLVCALGTSDALSDEVSFDFAFFKLPRRSAT